MGRGISSHFIFLMNNLINLKKQKMPFLQIAAMRDVSATETAVIYGLEPIWGAGFAWFLLGERWGMMGWIGAALILGKIQFLDCLFH